MNKLTLVNKDLTGDSINSKSSITRSSKLSNRLSEVNSKSEDLNQRLLEVDEKAIYLNERKTAAEEVIVSGEDEDY